MNNFFVLSNVVKQVKQVFFSLPKPSLPTRYVEMAREIKKSPIKLRKKFYFLCIYVWNIQQKITVTDIISYSSVEDPLGLQSFTEGEEESLELETKKQVKITIESLYRPNTWTQITTSIPFQLAIGGGILFLYLQPNLNQSSISLNFFSQINTKILSSIFSASEKDSSQLDLTVYGKDWLLIKGKKQFFTNESPFSSLYKGNQTNSPYFRKIMNQLGVPSQGTSLENKDWRFTYLPVDLGFENNKTNYYYRQYHLCNIPSLKAIEKKPFGSENKELIHKTSLFHNNNYDKPFLSFHFMDKILVYGILPYVLIRIWLAPSFVLWWSYKFDDDRKKEIKKNIKKIHQTELIKIQNFIDKTVTFRDVGGMESLKKELKTVAFLLRNKKYSNPYPTGYIFAGPPGTGKTLMAKAMAYEAQTPYIYVEGYQFKEKDKTIAIGRVDNLFNQIGELSPCILYIDEIDSIGERRDNNGGNTKATSGSRNDNAKPSDTILMKFLLHMDGYKTRKDLILIGATNRLEILDDALLRPGRFDRQILFSPPLVKERVDILQIFLSKSKIPLESSDIQQLAQRSMGFNGGELRLLADNLLFFNTYTKKNQKEANNTIDQAFERISRVRYKISDVFTTFNKNDITRTACHEIGKALIHILLPHSFPVYSIQLFPKPFNDRFLEIERKNIRVPSMDLISTNNLDYLVQKIVSLLAGRAAECAFFNENLDHISTYLNRSFDPNLYVAYQTSRYMIELGLIDPINGTIPGETTEQTKNVSFSHLYQFFKDKASLKETRQLQKTVKLDFQQPFFNEFWYEQDYVWDFDFIQQNKIIETEERVQIDIQTVYCLHTLFQYTYEFLK